MLTRCVHGAEWQPINLIAIVLLSGTVVKLTKGLIWGKQGGRGAEVSKATRLPGADRRKIKKDIGVS